MGEVLTQSEIDEFARGYGDPLAAGQVLEAAGLERQRHPAWNARSAVEFWREVARLLAHGALPEGRRHLGAAAHVQFPGNATFAACAGAVVRRKRVLISWEEVWAAWPLPSPFVERPALVEAVRDELTVSGAGPVGLVGMGGAGKSTTTRAVLHDRQIRDRLPDGAPDDPAAVLAYLRAVQDRPSLLETFVAHLAPRLFALVEEDIGLLEGEVFAWGLQFDGHAHVVSDSGADGSFDTADEAQRLFSHGSRCLRLVWYTPLDSAERSGLLRRTITRHRRRLWPPS